MTTQNGTALDIGLRADIADSVPRYLEQQAQALNVSFEGMIIFKYVFHNHRLLLLQLANTITSGRGKYTTPLARPLNHAQSITANDRSPIDRVVTNDLSVYSIARTAVLEQTGLDTSQMSSSNPGAIHIPITISQGQADDNSHWLSINIMCERSSAENDPARADGLVATSIFWANEHEVQEMDSTLR